MGIHKGIPARGPTIILRHLSLQCGTLLQRGEICFQLPVVLVSRVGAVGQKEKQGVQGVRVLGVAGNMQARVDAPCLLALCLCSGCAIGAQG